MLRNWKELISIDAIKHLIYIPVIIYKIKNWYPFLFNYIGIRNTPEIYHFRNGLKIKTGEGIDAATIAVIFIKKDYGNIPNDSTIIDIGGNIGVFALYALNDTNNVLVYCYEPVPKTYTLLLENIKLNHFNKKIIPIQKAVSGKSGRTKLFLGVGSPFHSLCNTTGPRKDINKNTINIATTSLKDVFDKNKIATCDILKIDCEGSEFDILFNTPKAYFDKIKEIRMEYHLLGQKNANLKKLIKFLQQNDFKIVKLYNDSKAIGNIWLIHT
jgi:FkbM family methyltransferase